MYSHYQLALLKQLGISTWKIRHPDLIALSGKLSEPEVVSNHPTESIDGVVTEVLDSEQLVSTESLGMAIEQSQPIPAELVDCHQQLVCLFDASDSQVLADILQVLELETALYLADYRPEELKNTAYIWQISDELMVTEYLIRAPHPEQLSPENKKQLWQQLQDN